MATGNTSEKCLLDSSCFDKQNLRKLEKINHYVNILKLVNVLMLVLQRRLGLYTKEMNIFLINYVF